MTPVEFIELISELLLYVVPGFVVLKLIEAFTPRKKVGQMETVLWSVFYSFIITIVYQFSGWVINWIIGHCFLCSDGSSIKINIGNNLKVAIYLFLSGIVSYLIVKFSRSAIGDKIAKKYNPNMALGEDVWFKSLKTEQGAWATVYLKNGMIYTGTLSKFTADADNDAKLILLERFRLMARVQDAPQSQMKDNQFCFVVDDKTDNTTSRVLLKYEDIIAIELVD